MRFRNVFLGIGSILVMAVLLLSDPDSGLVKNLPFGAGTLSFLIILVSSVLYIGVLHLGRKALFDYIDLEEYFKKAKLSPEGAGYALISVGLFSIAIAIVILAASKI
jgi:hypothetical protein